MNTTNRGIFTISLSLVLVSNIVDLNSIGDLKKL